MKALITGSRGFVGGYLRRELEQNGYEVVGLDLQADERTVQADLLKPVQMEEAVRTVAPDVVFHLAGQASVAQSWKIPLRTFELNVLAAVNLLDTVRAFKPATRMVLVGSSDQYGALGEVGEGITETMCLQPQTPYAISKRAQEEMASIYVRAYGMNISMTRSFNHGGAGQRIGFIIPDFCSGIVKIERGESQALQVGNLEAKRDFTHVKDVVRAYRLIAEQGRSGEVYNVGSGKAHSGQEILDKLIALARCPITTQQSIAKIRAMDTPISLCDNSKLLRETGWQPQYTLDDMLQDTLDYYRSKDNLL